MRPLQFENTIHCGRAARVGDWNDCMVRYCLRNLLRAIKVVTVVRNVDEFFTNENLHAGHGMHD
jgi:hypothetical protein